MRDRGGCWPVATVVVDPDGNDWGAAEMFRPSRSRLRLPCGEPTGIQDRTAEATEVRPAALLGANSSEQLGR